MANNVSWECISMSVVRLEISPNPGFQAARLPGRTDDRMGSPESDIAKVI